MVERPSCLASTLLGSTSMPGKRRRPTREGSGTHGHVWRRRSEQRLRRAAAMGWGQCQGRTKTLAAAGERWREVTSGGLA